MKLITLILISMTLVSCASNTKPYRGKYAPVNETRQGLYKYINTKLAWINENNREKAYKAIHETCGGDYTLTRVTSNGYINRKDNVTNVYDENAAWIYLQYKCI